MNLHQRDAIFKVRKYMIFLWLIFTVFKDSNDYFCVYKQVLNLKL